MFISIAPDSSPISISDILTMKYAMIVLVVVMMMMMTKLKLPIFNTYSHGPCLTYAQLLTMHFRDAPYPSSPGYCLCVRVVDAAVIRHALSTHFRLLFVFVYSSSGHTDIREDTLRGCRTPPTRDRFPRHDLDPPNRGRSVPDLVRSIAHFSGWDPENLHHL